MTTHLLHFCLVFGSRDERDGEALGAEAAGTTHTMQVLVGLTEEGGGARREEEWTN